MNISFCWKHMVQSVFDRLMNDVSYFSILKKKLKMVILSVTGRALESIWTHFEDFKIQFDSSEQSDFLCFTLWITDAGVWRTFCAIQNSNIWHLLKKAWLSKITQPLCPGSAKHASPSKPGRVSQCLGQRCCVLPVGSLEQAGPGHLRIYRALPWHSAQARWWEELSAAR